VNKYYKLAVKQCTNIMCLDPVFSYAFKVNGPPEPARILVSCLHNEVDVPYGNLDLKWNAIQSDNSILFYQWAISSENNGKRILTEWQTIKATNRSLYQVSLFQVLKHTYILNLNS
jgi:hypothetical protein